MGLGVRRIAHALIGPALIASVLIVFVSLTFLAAWALITLLDYTSSGALIAAWAVATLAGVLLVRQLPRVLDTPN